jgi:hypothetical protein
MKTLVTVGEKMNWLKQTGSMQAILIEALTNRLLPPLIKICWTYAASHDWSKTQIIKTAIIFQNSTAEGVENLCVDYKRNRLLCCDVNSNSLLAFDFKSGNCKNHGNPNHSSIRSICIDPIDFRILCATHQGQVFQYDDEKGFQVIIERSNVSCMTINSKGELFIAHDKGTERFYRSNHSDILSRKRSELVACSASERFVFTAESQCARQIIEIIDLAGTASSQVVHIVEPTDTPYTLCSDGTDYGLMYVGRKCSADGLFWLDRTMNRLDFSGRVCTQIIGGIYRPRRIINALSEKQIKCLLLFYPEIASTVKDKDLLYIAPCDSDRTTIELIHVPLGLI